MFLLNGKISASFFRNLVTKKSFVFFFALVLLTTCFIFFKQNYLKTGFFSKVPIAIDIRKEATEFKKWESVIDEKGGVGAYGDFVTYYKNQPYHIAHNLSHLMGATLYRKLGTSGIFICDDSVNFGYGCHHQFVMTAILEKGTSIVAELVDGCAQKYGTLIDFCAHGIGHGVMEFYGDDEPALVKALDACEKLEVTTSGVADKKRDNASSYCSAGVMMQYQHTLFVQGVPVRPVDESNPTAPCSTSVPERFRRDCYLSLGQWWMSYYSNDFSRVVSLCEGVLPLYQKFCYQGIGKNIPLANNFDSNKSLSLCSMFTAPSSRENCQMGVASMFQNREEDELEKVCFGVRKENLGLCLRGII